MKNFTSKFALTFVVVAVALTTFTVFFLPDQESDWGVRATRYKNEYAKSIKEPKILFLGASSTLMGVSAKTFEELSGIKSVNMGVHGGFSFRLLMAEARRVANPGDLIVLLPEYSFYTESLIPRNDFHYKRLNSPEDLLAMPIADFIKESLKTNVLDSLVTVTLHGLKNIISANERPFGLNEMGDYIYGFSTWGGHYGGESFIHPPADTWFVKAILAFNEACRKKNIKVILSYSNIMDDKSYHEPWKVENSRKNRQFFVDLGLDVLGEPRDFLFEAKYMLNGHYHLNNAGAIYRTQQLYEKLKDRLGPMKEKILAMRR